MYRYLDHAHGYLRRFILSTRLSDFRNWTGEGVGEGKEKERRRRRYYAKLIDPDEMRSMEVVIASIGPQSPSLKPPMTSKGLGGGRLVCKCH